jgi:AraC family transcriptional activator of pobA
LRKVPSFELYGEAPAVAAGQRLHIEGIQSRSRRYRWEIAPHTHRGLHQCVFVLQGPAEAQIEGTRTALKAPSIVLLPSASVHAFRFSAETQGYVLTIAPDALADGADDAGYAPFQQWLAVPRILELDGQSEWLERLRLLLERLAEEFRRPDSLHTPVCAWLARSVLWLVGQELARDRELPAGSARQHRWLAQLRGLIEQHYAEHWSVKRYARTLGLTEGRLNRLVQALQGKSVFGLVQARLALEARRRLTYVAMPVNQVANELGFKDPAYFCRFFKRHVGVSPRDFRQHRGLLQH